jgi:hypothetical protein
MQPNNTSLNIKTDQNQYKFYRKERCKKQSESAVFNGKFLLNLKKKNTDFSCEKKK